LSAPTVSGKVVPSVAVSLPWRHLGVERHGHQVAITLQPRGLAGRQLDGERVDQRQPLSDPAAAGTDQPARGALGDVRLELGDGHDGAGGRVVRHRGEVDLGRGRGVGGRSKRQRSGDGCD
jgi:hypothetical protein